MPYTLHPLTVEDEPFLRQMLYYAAHVDEEPDRSVADVQADAVLRTYVTDWGRDGDLGVKAVDDITGTAWGAAWVRLPTAGGGYSVVDADTPEMAIAVLPTHTGRGIGTALLNHLLAAARGRYPQVVLSVRATNPAARLYERLGFVTRQMITNRVGGQSFEMIYTWERGDGTNTNVIRAVEEASINAWPAHQTVIDHGWLVRFAGGYTRRSNSVLPIYSCGEDDATLAAKIARCEGWYWRRQQPPVFKITPLVQPADLDAKLADLGYTKEAPTGVRICSLADLSPAIDAAVTVDIDPAPSPAWIATFARLSQFSAPATAALPGILAAIVPATAFVTLRADGDVVACGLGVCQGTFVGLYDIVTAAHVRGRGYGTQLLQALLAWGKAAGAETAYLAVMDDNAPARALYSKLGFREIYKYWYRVKT